MEKLQDLKYSINFINTYKEYMDADKSIREGVLLKLQTSNIMEPIGESDLICGMMKHKFVGFSPQYGGLYCYYFHSEDYMNAVEELRDVINDDFYSELISCHDFMIQEMTAAKFDLKMDEVPCNVIVGRSFEEPGVGNFDVRLAGTNVDFSKLLKLGLNGLKQELEEYDTNFSKGLILSIESIQLAIQFYIDNIDATIGKSFVPRQVELRKIKKTLINIKENKPTTFNEALQLMWIYSVCSDLMNYGKMDRYLGEFYINDLNNGVITEQEGFDLLVSLYRHLKKINKMHDARIIIGGKNQSEGALLLSKLLVKVSTFVKDIVPQLTLNYHQDIDSELYNLSLEAISSKSTFPLIYNQDEVCQGAKSIFNCTDEVAETAIPFGCGEIVLESYSVGTPNNGINLLKAFELVFTQGYCNIFNKQISVKSKPVEQIKTFDELVEEYHKHLVPVVNQCAKAKDLNYSIANEECSFLHLSLLMNDCINRQKPLLDGGARYKAASSEIFGIISTADSLSVIKELVFETNKYSLVDIQKAMLDNYVGHEQLLKDIKAVVKYGNDNSTADNMAQFVFDDISNITNESKKLTSLDVYTIVSVNNSMSAEWGEYVIATPCGRLSKSPMSNANAPSIGADKNGITSLLNSMSKFDNSKHLGVINNVRLSKNIFDNNREMVKTCFNTYFKHGGYQSNICVIDSQDLINAKQNPEEYQDLIVRIGGFSAKFVELNSATQNEIILRTTHE